MLNSVVLMGRLTVSPELKNTANGKPVCSFGLATDRDGKDAKTDFFDIVAYDKNAEFAAKYLQKGKQIALKGQLRTSEWTDKDGKKRKSYNVMVDRFYFADFKAAETSTFTPVEEDGFLPF